MIFSIIQVIVWFVKLCVFPGPNLTPIVFAQISQRLNYSVHSNLRQEKAANPQFTEAGNVNVNCKQLIRYQNILVFR